jgi:hypothetical protein
MNQEVVQPRNRECELKELEDNEVRKREAEKKKQLALQQMQAAAGENAVCNDASGAGMSDPVPRRWRYDYKGEPFKVTGKKFWPLHALESTRRNIFPTLEHENDGLILQVLL